MSGETEKDVSGWTTDTLKFYFDDLLQERDRRHEERFAAQEKATILAVTGLEARLHDLNEWRSENRQMQTRYATQEWVESRLQALVDKIDTISVTIAGMRGSYMGRAEAEALNSAIREKIDDLGARLNRDEGNRVGNDDRRKESVSNTTLLVSIVGAVLLAVSIVVTVILTSVHK